MTFFIACKLLKKSSPYNNKKSKLALKLLFAPVLARALSFPYSSFPSLFPVGSYPFVLKWLKGGGLGSNRKLINWLIGLSGSQVYCAFSESYEKLYHGCTGKHAASSFWSMLLLFYWSISLGLGSFPVPLEILWLPSSEILFKQSFLYWFTNSPAQLHSIHGLYMTHGFILSLASKL